MKEITKGIIALVIIICVAAGVYAYDLWQENKPLTLKEGDFAEIYYIAYLENGSVISSSFIGNVTYNASFEGNYTILPLKIYFGNDYPKTYPQGWSYSDIGTIEGVRIPDIKGLYNAMLGMKEGEEKNVTLSPEEAFGKAIYEGLKFNTSEILGFSTQFEVFSIQNGSLNLKWLPLIGENITVPQYWYYDWHAQPIITPPYWIWDNATKVVSFNNTSVILKTTPNKLDGITLYPWWQNMSNASYDDKKIYITTTPPLGNFTITTSYGSVYGRVINLTKDKINVVVSYGGNETTYELNRTEVFNRSIELPILFKNVPNIYVEEDLKKDGYSFHELSGKKMNFRIKLIKIYRVS